MRKIMKKRNGFTLAELLIVVVIIALLAGGIMTIMGSSSEKTRYTVAEKDLDVLVSAITQAYQSMGGFVGNVTQGQNIFTGSTRVVPFDGRFDSAVQSYLNKQLDEFLDPWGRPYLFHSEYTHATGMGFMYVWCDGTPDANIGSEIKNKNVTLSYRTTPNLPGFTNVTINSVRTNPFNKDTAMGRTVYNGM